MTKISLPLSTLIVFSGLSAAKSADYNIDSLNSMSLKELMNIQVETAGRIEQKRFLAPSNITVVTPTQIKQRGYQNLIDILRDVPGFDFSNHQDSAGEYTSHSVNRGIGGTPGNVQLLVLVDGIPQNHIAFNWSQPWGNQQIYSDLDRIEITQGPGSASYGANAYSGIVHFITKKPSAYPVNSITSHLGEYNSQSHSLYLSRNFSELTLQLAARKSQTDGDLGRDSHDPAGYFSAHPLPHILTADYDENGNYVRNQVSPLKGQYSLPGYNNQSDDWAIRGSATWLPKHQAANGLRRIALSYNKWDQKQGLGSYITGFEYQTRDSSYQKHHQADSLSLDIDYNFKQHIQLLTRVWQRNNKQLPDTGFKYTYRFDDLIKSYHSKSKQFAFEQQLNITAKQNWLIGYRLLQSDKMNQVVSLGTNYQKYYGVTTSDWNLAAQGYGLNQTSSAQEEQVDEVAVFAQTQGQWHQRLNYTLGLRYDHSQSYGTTLNPRLAFSYDLSESDSDHIWIMKYLYGEAFREPSTFELNDEFRGNSELVPEKIKTHELISNWFFELNELEITAKAALFYKHPI